MRCEVTHFLRGTHVISSIIHQMQSNIQNNSASVTRRIFVIGGIGSGKSSVCEILEEEYGFPVIDLDKLGHDILEDAEVKEAVRAAFGEGVFTEARIDRKKLGELAFSSEKNREELEAITHPAIARKAEEIAEKLTTEGNCSAVIFEVTAFREDEFKKYYFREGDLVVLVTADFDKRVVRLKDSRDLNEEQVRQITKQQLSDDEFKEFADVVIENNSDLNSLSRQMSQTLRTFDSFCQNPRQIVSQTSVRFDS